MKYNGNWLVDGAREIEVICHACHGNGAISVTRFDLCDWLEVEYRYNPQGQLNHYRVRNCYRQAMKIYREWKKTGTVPCAECEGRGRWTQWI
jgi:RecJ-like exonuclease